MKSLYPDPLHVASLIQDVAAAVILPRFRCLAPEEIREKKPGDLVTIADEESEQILTRQLAPLVPGSLVVGEEAVAADPARLAMLNDAEWAWILDPVDGTQNFARGKAMFAVIVALAHRGRTVMGWIYDPCRKVMAIAEAGQGATLNGVPLRLPAVPAGAPTLPARRLETLCGSLYPRFLPRSLQGPARALGQRLAKSGCLGSVAHEYLRLAQGELDFGLYGRLKPWDHAAGVLLLEEAGGRASLLNGASYQPMETPQTLLATTTSAVWEAVHTALTQ